MKPSGGKIRLGLADDKMCFGCGEKNPRGLKLKFDVAADGRSIRCRWTPTKEFQGYADIVHGGIVGLILDEMMVNLLWVTKRPAVTAELTVRYKKPATVGRPIDFEARVSSEESRIIRMQGEAKTGGGTLIASASARCVRVAS
ncbi:MAG: PaaI family thioesterase [Candidatus Omnitrophica bacterium]|nr:PaaI family thioesterase [Candidatus Omnitrophota bacterium]